MDSNYKEVFYDQYCHRCEHSEKTELEDPCFDCLDEPVNMDSHKPVYFEERK